MYPLSRKQSFALNAATLLVALLMMLAVVPAWSQALVIGNRIETPSSTQIVQRPDLLWYNDGLMRFTTSDGKLSLMSIEADGSLKFHYGATIYFSSQMTVSQTNVGEPVLYMLVGVNNPDGTLGTYVLPLHRFIRTPQ